MSLPCHAIHTHTQTDTDKRALKHQRDRCGGEGGEELRMMDRDR